MAQRAIPGEDNQQTGARAILRVLAVLTELAADSQGMTLAELTVRLDLPKASLFRILQTLRNAGYLLQEGNAFRLGAASIALARMIDQTALPSPFPACVRPVLEWLAEETGETVMLAKLPEGDVEVVYVDVIESSKPIRFAVNKGDRRPLYCAASGKAALAFLPPDSQQRYLKEQEFTRFTVHTADKASLARELENIHSSRLAFDSGGRIEGASGIASPVFNEHGKLLAAVSVAGPTDRIEGARDRIAGLVLRAAERASRIMGFREDFPSGKPGLHP